MAAETVFLEAAHEVTIHDRHLMVSPSIHQAQIGASYSYSTANDLLEVTDVLQASDRQILWPSCADSLANQYISIRGKEDIESEALIAASINGTFNEDPSYRSPAGLHEELMHNCAGISIDYSRTTNHELTQCTPFIPLPRSVQGEPPLYQYWHGLEDRHHEGLPSDFGAPTQFGSNRAKLRGIHRPIEVPDSQHVAKCDILVSPGHNAAKAIQGSQNQHEELKPFTDAASAATNISSPVELLSIQRNNTPCFECCFARVSKLKCEGIPGKPCTRCTKLAFQLPRQLKGSTEMPHFITEILLFDLKSIQEVLSNLRAEAYMILDLNPNIIVEDFLSKNPMICHMASQDELDPSLSRESVQVVMTNLSTTQKAASQAASSDLSFPTPGLNASQMDSFIKVASRMSRLECLTPIEKDIISAALKISDYMGILFNWDANMIRFDRTTRNYHRQDPENASLVLAKNIVLETVYSFVYRVQDLMKMICYEVNRSFLHPLDLSQDPATISCALWIMYTSLNCFQKLTWRETHLAHLKVFLNGMRGRAEGAITAIERYRKEFAFARCGRLSPYQNAFRELIVAKKVPKSAIAFAYERLANHPFLPSLPDYSSQQSYTEVLEARIRKAPYLAARYCPEENSEVTDMSNGDSKLSLADLYQQDEEPWPEADFDDQSTMSELAFDNADEKTMRMQRELSIKTLDRSKENLISTGFDLQTGNGHTEELKFFEDLRPVPQYKPDPLPENPDIHNDWIAPGKPSPSACSPRFGKEVDVTEEINLAFRRHEARQAQLLKRRRSPDSDRIDMSRKSKARQTMQNSVQQLPAAVRKWNEGCIVPGEDLVNFWLAEMEYAPFLENGKGFWDQNANFSSMA